MNKKKIFAVDDDFSIRFTLQGILEKEYDIETFENGQLALERMEEKIPDLFILDIEMPWISGIDLIHLLDVFEKDAKIPKLMLSSKNDIKTLKLMKQLGITHYALKPIDFEILDSKIAEALNKAA